jgi:hypothetical protein
MINSFLVERLVGFTLLLLLRYAIPRAQAVEVCEVEEPIESDQLFPTSRLKCQQGYYSKINGRCECDFNWSGELCEQCQEQQACFRKARITSVKPTSLSLPELQVIHFNGHGFPR